MWRYFSSNAESFEIKCRHIFIGLRRVDLENYLILGIIKISNFF